MILASSSVSGRIPCSPIVSHAMRHLATIFLAPTLLTLAACETGMQAIDRQTEERIRQASAEIGEQANVPSIRDRKADGNPNAYDDTPALRSPPTLNPEAAELNYTARERPALDPKKVIADAATPIAGTTIVTLDLAAAIKQAFTGGVEYRNAEEQYLLACLALLLETNEWTPRIFDTISPQFQSVDLSGNDILNPTGTNTNALALELVNEFEVTQKLPYGGQMSANILAQVADDLNDATIAGQNSVEAFFSLDVPLLKGAGLVAQEPLIQAQRNTIYAARAFEDFRRRFYVSLVDEYMGLVVQRLQINNAKQSILRFKAIVDREDALVASGRQVPFQADLAKQNALFAVDRLATQEEAFKLAVDRYKVRIGLPPDQMLEVEIELLDMLPPVIDGEAAVQMALDLRLDLQNSRDQVDDVKRLVELARNGLLPAVDLAAKIDLMQDPDFFNGVQLDGSFDDYTVGINIEVPLDRVDERIALRQAQLRQEQVQRAFFNTRDTVSVQVRQATRAIERSMFSLQLQERNISIAQQRQESIDAAPDRATPRDRTETVDALVRALNDRDRARRELQVAILGYLNSTG
ncbi:MAG: TolC family protein, partial [Phycisphaerae bacterium]|nr:TolC family protein [Phycisphaerae bacterium]